MKTLNVESLSCFSRCLLSASFTTYLLVLSTHPYLRMRMRARSWVSDTDQSVTSTSLICKLQMSSISLDFLDAESQHLSQHICWFSQYTPDWEWEWEPDLGYLILSNEWLQQVWDVTFRCQMPVFIFSTLTLGIFLNIFVGSLNSPLSKNENES